MSKPNVIVAVPNFNMGQQVSELLPQLTHQGFERIYILDDHSTDDASMALYDGLSNQATVVRGERNLGAAGNRNRIIQALGAKGLQEDDIVLFIDADTQLVDDNMKPDSILSLFVQHPEAAAIGGKVLNADGSWGAFNYGPLSLRKWLKGTPLQLKMERLNRENPKEAAKLTVQYPSHFEDWPNPLEVPHAKEVGWLVETLLCIRLDVFKEVNGYDPRLRYCEALDLGAKLEDKRLKRVFDPNLVIKHLQVDNRGRHRNVEVAAAVARLSWQRAKRRLF